MAKFQYKARDKEGKMISGTMYASDEDDLYRRLKDKGIFMIQAGETKEELLTGQLSPLALSDFCRELGDMLGAGITLVKALTILAQEETRKEKEREILMSVLKRIRQGEAMSEAMEQQGGAFPTLMIHMFRAAEASGNMAKTARRMSAHYEKEHHLNTKIKGATTYPKILCVLVVLVLIFIVSVILPQLTDLFDTLDTLPLPTRVLFGLSSFFTNHWKAVIVFVVSMVIIYNILMQMPSVRFQLDRMKLKVPVFGKLLSVIYTARFARSLSSLYSAGIPIVSAIQIVRKTIGNAYLEGQFDRVISDLRGGKSLSEALDTVDGFKKKLSSVIRVGEESGNLEVMLDSLADSFDYDSEMAVTRMISYLEPILIVFMAAVVGFIMISVMLPIYDSYTAIETSSYY